MKEQLEQIGIYHEESKLKPFKYWCNITQGYLKITDKMTMEDVVKMVYEKGIELGLRDGKEQRSNEFKRLLNNEDLF